MTDPHSEGRPGSDPIEVGGRRYLPPEPSAIMKALWWCAGADRSILRSCPYGDHVKYASMGGLVLATGLLAALAMGFAMYTVFGTPGAIPVDAPKDVVTASKSAHLRGLLLALVIGPLWGVMILNLDRFIVSSTGKGDGKESISREERKNAWPRLLMAGFIAIIISVPLKVRIFHPEIQSELERRSEASIEAERERFGGAVRAAEQRLSEATAARAAAETRELSRREEAFAELQGRGALGRPVGAGRQYAALLNFIAGDSARRVDAEAVEAQAKAELAAVKAQLEAQIGPIIASTKAGGGLLARIGILKEIAPVVSWLIICLFVSIEVSPILFKLMMVKGPYDYLEESLRDLYRAREGIALEGVEVPGRPGADPESAHPRAINFRVEAAVESSRLLNDAQRRIHQAAVEAWTAEQIAQATRDPHLFVDTSEQPAHDRGGQPPRLDG